MTRFVVEQRAAGTVLERACEGLSLEGFEAMVTRLSMLYDIYYPPKKAQKERKRRA